MMSKFEKRQQAVSNGSHGIVIGSGIAGLLAARVLLNHFESVTLVERDSLPAQPGLRPGVAQTVHSHGLLKRGSNILEQLFPGLEAELVAAGAILADEIGDILVLDGQDATFRFASDLIVPQCSRSLLEWAIRARLLKSDRLQLLEATQVKKMLTDATNSRITGLQLCDRVREASRREARRQGGRETSQLGELTADLVVDTSGRQSRAPQWLTELGYCAPAETKVDAFFGYTTRLYELPPQLTADWKTLLVIPQYPHSSRMGILSKIEGNLWTMSLYGYNRDYPPTDEVGFLEFARSLSNPALYEAIKSAKPVSPIYSFRNTENRLRHYERLKLPEGFVVMGDAAFAFNPLHGQGMTAAAMGALELDRCLQRQLRSGTDLTGLSQNFQKRLAQVLQSPWRRATSDDLRWLSPVDTTTSQQLNWIDRFVKQYWQEFSLLLKSNPEIYRNSQETRHMVRTPTTFSNLKFPLAIAKQVLQRKIANYIHTSKLERSLTRQ
jgi:2-polyprenyl-6-methoxyphenol hydroxylase-like FAD-dependent oxidoreductase